MSIRLEHVSYAYEDNSSKKNYALKDINLEIKKEELGLVLVNGLYSDITLDLNDNDVLAVFPPVAGG